MISVSDGGPYDQGQTAKLSVTITDPSTGNLYDPATVVFKLVAPGSTTVITPAVTRTSAGVYYAEQEWTSGGWWWYRVDTTGPVGGAERRVWVNASNIPGG